MNQKKIKRLIEKASSINSSLPRDTRTIALLILGNDIYIGWNTKLKVPQIKGIKYESRHAEVHAIQQALKYRDSVKGGRLYVLRFLKKGTVSMAMPCWKCRDYLKSVGISHRDVYYSDWSGVHSLRRLV